MPHTDEQIKAAAELMVQGFKNDPGIKAQMGGLEEAEGIMLAQSEGQIRAFDRACCVTMLDGGPSFLLGYRTDELPLDKLVPVLQEAAGALMEAVGPQTIAELQERVAPVAAITDELWYLQSFPDQSVYVLQVIAVEPRLKGTGAFRRLLGPVLEGLDRDGITAVLQTHNPVNVPIYEHFGFQVVDAPHSEELGLTCYNMARTH